MLHPLRQRVLQEIAVDESSTLDSEDEARSEDPKWKSKKRARDPLFSLDKQQTKYLRLASQESMAPSSTKASSMDEANITIKVEMSIKDAMLMIKKKNKTVNLYSIQDLLIKVG